MCPRRIEKHCWEPLKCGRPHCPLSSSVPLSFTFHLASPTDRFRSAPPLTGVDKGGKRNEVSGPLLVGNCSRAPVKVHTQRRAACSVYHLPNICLPSNVASKAACYLDCIRPPDTAGLDKGAAANGRIVCRRRLKRSASLSPSRPDNGSVSLCLSE